jgi:hypothetical protein
MSSVRTTYWHFPPFRQTPSLSFMHNGAPPGFLHSKTIMQLSPVIMVASRGFEPLLKPTLSGFSRSGLSFVLSRPYLGLKPDSFDHLDNSPLVSSPDRHIVMECVYKYYFIISTSSLLPVYSHLSTWTDFMFSLILLAYSFMASCRLRRNLPWL